MPENITTTTTSANPYVGPRPFQPGERIYGRDQEIYDLLDLLIAERIVLLYSPSGAGKTSLIQAGLLPELEEEGFRALPVMRVSLEPPLSLREEIGSYNRYILSLLLSLEESVPKDRQVPLPELARLTLAEYLERVAGSADTENAYSILNAAASPAGLDASRMPAVPGKIVLLFDQFEEILTVDPTDYDVKVEFFTQVGAALRHRDYWALFSMREEFPARLDPYVRHVPTRLSNRFRLELLDAASAVAAIHEPVQDIGVRFDGTATTKLVDDLRRVRVQQPDGVIAELPGMYVEPVQLQVVCHRLWSHLPEGIVEIREDDIRAAGDVDSALAGYYAERVKEIARQTNVSERSIREWFLHHLITDQGIRGQIVREPEETQGLANEAIEELVDAHLVRAEQRRGVTWYELAHDRLIEPIQFDNYDWLQEHLSTLQREAALWELQERTSGLLLLDEALKEVEQWASEHHEELTETEQEFLQACREEQVREQRECLKSGFIRGLAITATIVMCVAVFFYMNAEARRKESERLSFVSLAQNLMNEAMQQKHDDFKLLLLRQAYLFNQKGRGKILAQIDRHLRDEFGVRFFSRARYFDDSVMAVAISADGRYLASGIGDGTIQILDLRDSAPIPLTLNGHQGPICSLAFHPDGRYLASAGWDRTVRLWELPFSDADPVILFGHTKAVFSVAFSPDGNRLASGSWDTSVRLWDLRNLQQSAQILQGHEAGVNSVAFSPNGQFLASGSSDETIRLWKMSSPGSDPDVLPFQHPERSPTPSGKSAFGRRQPPLSAGRGSPPSDRPQPSGEEPQPFEISEVNAVAFSPDGVYLAAGTSGKKIWLWNMQNLRQPPTVLESHHDRVLSLAFSPDGQLLASGAEDHEIRLCTLEDLQAQPEVLRGHDAMVFDVAFSPDGRLLASGSSDETVRLWELYTTEDSMRVLSSPYDEALLTDEASSGNEASSVNKDPLWSQPLADRQNPGTGDGNAGSSGPAPSIQSIAFSNDGRTVYATTEQHEMIIWHHDGQAQVVPFLGSAKQKVTSSAFAPDKTQVALGDDGGGIYLWNIDKTALFPQTLSGHTGSVDALAFHPDGTMLASGGDDYTVRVWKNLQAPSPQPPLVLRGHEGTILSLAFHPTKEVLVSGGDDGAILLWNLQFPDYPPISLTGHEEAVFAVAFTPDGMTLASLSDDSSVYLWDLRNLRTDFIWLLQLDFAFSVMYEGDELFSSMAFSPDGKTLALRGPHNIRLWNLDNLDANPVILEERIPQPQQAVPTQTQNQPLLAPGMPPPYLPAPEEDDIVLLHPLAFSPDGEVLAITGRQNASVILWTRTEALIEAVCRRVWQNFNEEEWEDYIGSGMPYEPTCPNFQ